MKYTAYQIKNWSSSTPDKDGCWKPARPITIYRLLERIGNAWLVLIGKFDALDWEEE
jgi:hypothetical protein